MFNFTNLNNSKTVLFNYAKRTPAIIVLKNMVDSKISIRQECQEEK